ncbi:MAG: hypothetical protein A3F78_21955 [Burkholderiales bacterium RIFCSPLOWO2_12_FULL_61_40]|nr:MAG: hypothetical protein A3F78_21955 [Burkholderiales bacterium RIFCSPLOWO2_12_FULL_61_40]
MIHLHSHPTANRRRTRTRQRGAVAIVVGLMIAVMVGFIGLALDGGHLYLTKTELQNSADACALAASYELTGAPTISPAAFDRAEKAGQTVGTINKVDFQGTPIALTDVSVRFSTTLSAGSSWVNAGAASTSSKYVRCTLTRSGIAPWFMQVLGFGAQTVNALATATLTPAQTNCAMPMGLCVQAGGTAANNFGYTVGDWYGLDFAETGGGDQSAYTGNFRWLDFDPGGQTPGCPGGGAQELACLVKGAGQCSLPAPIVTGGCASSGNTTDPGCVGENGNINAMSAAYNSRFGLYKGSNNATNAPMDFTGNAYRIGTWTLGRNAYNGTVAGEQNFKTARSNFVSTQGMYVPGGGYSNASQAEHQTGADRRMVVMPMVDCSGFTAGQHAPIRGYACVLMLDPYDKNVNDVISKLEFEGLANVPGSPCASSGIAGDTTSIGPMVPALVQ